MDRPIMSSWVGGKSKLCKTIIPLIPKHTCYVEPFAGAAWVFWKKEKSKVEVLNDINNELINLYRVVQNHFEEFAKHFKWTLVSREEFNRLQMLSPEYLTDVQRAVRFYYLHKNAFGGKIDGQNFGYATISPPKLNLLNLEKELLKAHSRLAKVFIENLTYDDLIKRYDRTHTFFYIDPPYWGFENDYGKGIFDKSDFQTLAEILKHLQGKFILSLNDVPEVRNISKGFNFKEVQVAYTCGKKHTTGREVLIKNF